MAGFLTPRVLLVCSSVLTALSAASTAAAQQSWAGKEVFLTKAGIRIGHTGEKGEQVYVATLRDCSYRVLADKDAWLKVRERGVEGWFEKSDAILLEDAVDHFTARIRANPRNATAYLNRALAWHRKGEFAIAIKDLDEAIRLSPRDAAAFQNRGIAWAATKEYDKAIKDFDEAIRLEPKDSNTFISRGYAWQDKKQYSKAIKDFDEAVRVNPKDALALNGKAWLLSTCPAAQHRDGKLAIELSTKACESTAWNEPTYLDTLAAAYAEVGQFDEAVKWVEKALQNPHIAKQDENELRVRVKLYREKKPYRE